MMYRVARVLLVLCAVFFVQAAHAGPALVFDPKTGLVLYSEDADRPWYPASLTKMMTAYIAFEAIRDKKLSLKSNLTMSKTARKMPPSKLGLPVGAKLRVDTALHVLIIKSANDVAVMFAEAISGSVGKFAVRMNDTARRLGMRGSRFVNPNGLPDTRQVTTARDMGLLARALIRDFPQYKRLFARKEMRFGKRRLRSHNSLLRSFKGADGMKTGFICASGFNVVASATRKGRQLVAVVLGSKSPLSRGYRATRLLERGFKNYWWHTFAATRIDGTNRATLSSLAPRRTRPKNMRPLICTPKARAARRRKAQRARRRGS